MMKDYKLFKTAKKTAKENGLVFADNQRIFDFSSLDELNFLKRKNSIKGC